MKASSNLLHEKIKSLKSKPSIVFDDFRMNIRNRSLEKSGSLIHLAPKVFETLALLVHSSPNAVSREELRATLWPEAVEESVLGQYVYLLRKALGNRPNGEAYIETLPKLGYRFTGDVRNGEVQSAPDPPLVFAPPSHSRAFLMAGSAGVLLLAIAGLMMLRFRHRVPKPEAVRLTRLAIAIWKQRHDVIDDERYFREAIRIDPDYAEAHAGLAAALAVRGTYPPREAKAEVTKALALDTRSSFAYAARGFLAMVHDWDWTGAGNDLRHATELDPANSTAAQWYALFLALQGQNREGLRILDKALAREPDSPNLLTEQCDLFYFDRRYTEAASACTSALRVNSGFLFAEDRLLYVRAMAGEWEDAISLVPGGTIDLKARFHRAIDQEGGSNFWRVLKDNLIETHGHPFYIARAYAQSNDRTAALTEIERFVSSHVFHSVFLGADPALASLHSEARFQAACPTAGIPRK